jgi:hypothetical protein
MYISFKREIFYENAPDDVSAIGEKGNAFLHTQIGDSHETFIAAFLLGFVFLRTGLSCRGLLSNIPRGVIRI